MDVNSLRKMPKQKLQDIAQQIARSIGLRVEGIFTKGDFLELTGKRKMGEEEREFALVMHTGNLLRADFINAFKESLKKENASALLLTTGMVESFEEDENLEIVAGNKLLQFFEEHGIFEEQTPEIPKVLKEKKGSESALPSAGVLENYMKAGLKFFERREYEKALECFEKVLEMKPGYDRAISLKARTYSAMGEKDVAIETYRKALDMMPDRYELWYEYADLLHEMGRYDEELECYAKILEENKKLDKVWNNMGIVYFIKERYEDALFCFEKASKLRQDNPDYLNNLATAYKKLGKLEEAIATYKKVLELAPQHADALLNLGLLYHEMKKFEEAYNALKKYLEKERKSAKVWHLAGICAMNASLYGEAIKCFEEAVRLSPELKEAREGLREAKRKFSQKRERVMREESKLIGVGVSQKIEEQKETPHVEEPKEPAQNLSQEKSQESFASLFSALAKAQERKEVRPDLIWSYIKSGKFEDALKILDNVEQKQPAIALASAYAYANLGIYEKALERIESLSGHRMQIPASFGKEMCEFYLGRYDEALSTINSLLQKFPNDCTLLLKKCLVLYLKRMFAECEIELKKIAKDMQHNEFYWYLLGKVNLEQGKKEVASKCFENVHRLKQSTH